ncbi:MAG: carbohydrate ABC transporter permease [Clostridia bacterium]|nr:carbohydrate ABC transporter permease [Clostridia bacterium]
MWKSLRIRRAITQGAIILIMGLFMLLFMMPYAIMLLNSFRDKTEIMKGATILPTRYITDNYITVWTKAPILSWLKNSVIVSVVGTLLMLFTSSIAGFVFAKYTFRWKNAIFWFILATMMVPAQVTMIPSFLLIDKLGMYDSLQSLIIPRMVGGFGIFLCRQFIEDIPDSLCEAASIDGASDLFVYRNVIIPLILPAISALAIFEFLSKWNDYLGPLIYLANPKNMTMPLAITFFSGQRSSDIGAIMAASALIMLPVTLVFLAFQKQFVKGIAITGMK